MWNSSSRFTALAALWAEAASREYNDRARGCYMPASHVHVARVDVRPVIAAVWAFPSDEGVPAEFVGWYAENHISRDAIEAFRESCHAVGPRPPSRTVRGLLPDEWCIRTDVEREFVADNLNVMTFRLPEQETDGTPRWRSVLEVAGKTETAIDGPYATRETAAERRVLNGLGLIDGDRYVSAARMNSGGVLFSERLRAERIAADQPRAVETALLSAGYRPAEASYVAYGR